MIACLSRNSRYCGVPKWPSRYREATWEGGGREGGMHACTRGHRACIPRVFRIAVPQNDFISRRETALVLSSAVTNSRPYIFIVGNGFRQITFNCGLPEFVSTFLQRVREGWSGQHGRTRAHARARARTRGNEERQDQFTLYNDAEAEAIHEDSIDTICTIEKRTAAATGSRGPAIIQSRAAPSFRSRTARV